LRPAAFLLFAGLRRVLAAARFAGLAFFLADFLALDFLALDFLALAI
jgi:hypothetical protein